MRSLPFWVVCGALLVAGCEQPTTNPAANQPGATPHSVNKPVTNDQLPNQTAPPATPGQPSTPGAPGPIEPATGAVPPSGASSPMSNPPSGRSTMPTESETSSSRNK